jgi:hypothetical protein
MIPTIPCVITNAWCSRDADQLDERQHDQCEGDKGRSELRNLGG